MPQGRPSRQSTCASPLSWRIPRSYPLIFNQFVSKQSHLVAARTLSVAQVLHKPSITPPQTSDLKQSRFWSHVGHVRISEESLSLSKQNSSPLVFSSRLQSHPPLPGIKKSIWSVVQTPEKLASVLVLEKYQSSETADVRTVGIRFATLKIKSLGKSLPY